MCSVTGKFETISFLLRNLRNDPQEPCRRLLDLNFHFIALTTSVVNNFFICIIFVYVPFRSAISSEYVFPILEYQVRISKQHEDKSFTASNQELEFSNQTFLA
jgi:hypothetical protein